MEIINENGRFFWIERWEIPAEIAGILQEHLLELRKMRPEIFPIFLAYCQEYFGNEEIIPANWRELRNDFADYLCHVLMA